MYLIRFITLSFSHNTLSLSLFQNVAHDIQSAIDMYIVRNLSKSNLTVRDEQDISHITL